ncbi:MAG: hypothetical protein ACLPUG_07030 [Acidimicrobiales bacterium]
MTNVTLFWSLYNAALNGDLGAASDMIDSGCEYVMMPTMEVSRGKPAVLKAMGLGAGAFDRTQPPKILFDAATSEWGVFEFVNEGTVASGIVDFATNSDWQFSGEPSMLVGHSYKAPVCVVYHINAQRKIYRIHEYTDVASLMKSIT